MSRQIDLTKKLTDEEREYLEARGDFRSLDENTFNLMSVSDDEEEAGKQPLSEVKAILKERNLPTAGKAAELRSRLAESDAALAAVKPGDVETPEDSTEV